MEFYWPGKAATPEYYGLCESCARAAKQWISEKLPIVATNETTRSDYD